MPTDKVTIEFEVKSGDAERKIKKLKDDVQKSANESEQRTKSLSETVFFGLNAIEAAARAGQWAFKKLTEGLSGMEAKAEDISKTNFFSGLSTDEIQKMQGALKKVGVDFNSFYSSYMRFQQLLAGPSVGQMMDTQKQLAFGILGINPYGYSSAEEALEATAKRLLQEKDVGKRNLLAGMLDIDPSYLYALERGIDAFAMFNKLSKEQIELRRRNREEAAKQEFMIEQAKDATTYGFKSSVRGMYQGARGSFWGADYISELAKREGLDASQRRVAKVLESAMRDAGGGEAQVRAFVGNAFAESSFIPTKENGSHKGLFQWDTSRWNEYLKWRSKHSFLPEDVAQAKYAIIEAKGRYGGKFWKEFMASSHPQETTDLWESGFEVSGRQGMGNRYRGALVEPMAVGSQSDSGGSTIVNDNSRKVYVNGVQVDASTPIGNLSEAQAVGG